ncbi:MAG: hypothetical protein KJS91_12365 [Planctomycetes bacterium]|nr:hypothetical protein [Planctomycetota bacterium]
MDSLLRDFAFAVGLSVKILGRVKGHRAVGCVMGKNTGLNDALGANDRAVGSGAMVLERAGQSFVGFKQRERKHSHDFSLTVFQLEPVEHLVPVRRKISFFKILKIKKMFGTFGGAQMWKILVFPPVRIAGYLPEILASRPKKCWNLRRQDLACCFRDSRMAFHPPSMGALRAIGERQHPGRQSSCHKYP